MNGAVSMPTSSPGGSCRSARPRVALAPDVLLRIDPVPHLAMQPEQLRRVVVGLRHEKDVGAPDVDQQAISTLDTQPAPRRGRNGDLEFVADLDGLHHTRPAAP